MNHNPTKDLEAPTDILEEVRKLKEENAAAHNYDVAAIGAAARKNQQAHPHRVVSRRQVKEPIA